MTIEQDLVDALARLHNDVTSLINELRVRPVISQAISTKEQLPALLSNYQQSYGNHLFVKAPAQLSATPQTYPLPNPVDAIVVEGTADYQVEFDRNVTSQTPIIPAFSTFTATLKVQKTVSYVIPKEFLDTFGATYVGNFYIWMFWY